MVRRIWLKRWRTNATDSSRRPKLVNRRPKPLPEVPNSNESSRGFRAQALLASVLHVASKSYERNLVFSGGAPSAVRDRSVKHYASAATAPVAAALLYASISASNSSAVGLPFFAGLP